MCAVLLLEPHRDSRDIYVEFLSHEGFHVLTAETTDDALSLVSLAHVLVSELQVAGSVDVLSLIRRLRATRRSERLRIIVVSAWTLECDKGAASEAGCDLFLPKPCLPGELAAAIREALPTPRFRRSITRAERRSGAPRNRRA